MYAENAQISHRQLFRQMVTGLLGIYALLVPTVSGIAGKQGRIALLTGMIVYLLLCTCFVRIKVVFQYPERYFGKLTGRFFMLIYVSWLWLAGCYLLLRITRITQRFLVEKGTSWMIILLAAGAAYIGSHQGLERRARMAEACFPILIFIFAGMLFLGMLRINPQFLFVSEALSFSGWRHSAWNIICLFLPFAFLPITLGNVEKPGETRGSMGGGIGFITVFLILTLVLLQGSFGQNGYGHKSYPLADCMAGIQLPGNFLERVDVFWIAAVLFSVLFSLGSIFFYQHELLVRAEMEMWSPVFSILMVITAIFGAYRRFPEDWFVEITIKYYGIIFILLFLSAELAVRKKRIWKKAAMLFIPFSFLFLLYGCGVSLEDRVFPLSLSIDYAQGNYKVIYGIPQVPAYEGKSMEEAEKNFEKNQKNYLDMGHIKVCILGTELLKEKRAYEEALAYLESNPAIAGNIYVFSSSEIENIMNRDDQEQDSVGDNLSKLLEKNVKKKDAVTLQDLYNARYREEKIPQIPMVTIVNKKLQISQYS